MNDRFIRLSISLARLQKVIQRIKASGMSRIELKAGHTLVLCRLAAAPEGLHFSELTERCGLDPAMISRVLAELVRSGLVEKRAESGKYNALYLLTNAGHDRAARVGAVVWQRRCRAAAAGAVLKPSGGNCAVLPIMYKTARLPQNAAGHLFYSYLVGILRKI